MLPAPLTSGALRIALEKKLGLSLLDSKLVLAPESDRYCATLSMKCQQSPFELGQPFDLEIDIGDCSQISANVTPDNTFIRMTTLYDGTQGNKYANQAEAVDFIVVPGLSSHAFGSFKSPRDATENWLRDYLPTTLPNIRVLVYGYDSHLLTHEGKESIVDHAKGLLDSIRSHRQDPQTAHRPFIFLGHSLGGLVIKQALTTLSCEIGRNKQDEQLFKACYGLLFFGVPNLGLRHEELLGAVIGKMPSENLIRDLIVTKESEPSAFLTALSESFVTCCKLQEFKVVAFYETLNSNTLEQNPDGRWARSGPKKLMVTKASATWIHGQANSRKEIPLSTDHSGLVKFTGRSDPQYTDSVKFHIEEMVKAAPSTINERFSRMHGLSSDQRAVLDSLRLDPVHEIRDGKIDDPCADTLKWFFIDSRFQSWRDSPEAPCFWVYGPPGQGKSVLAKSLTSHLEKYARTRPAENIAVLSFFCYGQGEQSRRPTDILRSLIIQLIDCKELFDYLPERYRQDPATFRG
ncbi:protein serac1 q2tbm9 [Diplodia corticola]|uniref:Protein serac1 q2tbm9 n=1 Tax=Diplodia corticola TaxID=236234 RepID=A0A1J9S2T1_9PEZI|nr:protein serac1 q2tbm9 [Diplodia corticola]OJD34863.1 protein serac1 q2tbm9 [Diplodia corticola]